jgi:outer membrane receptor for ferrienterochelin and colicins
MKMNTATRSAVARIPQDRIVPCMLLASLLAGTAARAQSVDYGALEQLFGEAVTTSVTGKPQRATDAPANIEIVTQDDIRRSGATSIPEVLQFVTGVDVRFTGIANADVGIRGYNQIANPHLMVLVDGRQVYMVDYGRIVWAAIPVQLAEIRQIEVIKGPNSALYGFNAAGGVINIITYDPRKDLINTATVSGGTQDYRAGSAVATGRIGDAGLRLSLGGFKAQDFPPGPLSTNDQLSRHPPFTGTFNADGRAQVTPNVELLADLSVGDTRLSNPSPAGAYLTEEQHSNSFRLGVNADTRIGVLSLSGYRNEANMQVSETSSNRFGDIFTFRQLETQTVTVVQASDLVKLGPDHTVRAGLEHRVNSDESAMLAGSVSNTIYAANLMWDWQVAPTVSITNAVRVDYVQIQYGGTLLPYAGTTASDFNKTTFTEPSFNSGVVWKVTDLDTLRLTAARGVQLPTLMDQALQVPAGELAPVAFLGRPDVQPSVIYNIELDYDRAFPEIGSTLRTAVFGQRTDDVISWPFGGPFSIKPGGVPAFSSDNVGYTTAAGIELGIKGRSDSDWRWSASYTLTATTDHTSLNSGPVLTSAVSYGCSAPCHVVNAGIGYSVGKWEVDMIGHWQSSFCDFRTTETSLALQRFTIDNYATLNARVGYAVLENLTVALAAQQLNQSSLARTAGPPYERRVIASVTAHF